MQLRHRSKRLIAHAITGLLALLLSLTHVTVQAEEFGEYDLLLLDFTLNRQYLAQSVTAYPLNDSIVVSLAEAGAALEFPISVDATNGTASGWFINKERRFELDINAATVTIEGIPQPLSSTDAIAHGHAIYVPLEVFSRWFPVNLTVQLTTMTIKVEPREPIPVQLRAQRRQLAGQRFIMAPPSLPEISTPYRLIGSHTADLSLGYHIRRDIEPNISAAKTSLNYSTLIRGDLAYMSSAIYLGGNNTDSLTYARMTLSRSHPDTPPGVNLIELGDITPTAIRGAPQNDIERGFLVQGSTLQDAELYSLDGNQTHISGDILEGWEVELLHNGIRIDYQIIGPEGRYDFRNLGLFSGSNNFELIFYGPSGEQRSETITRFGGADAIRKGNLSYQLSASQKAKPLHESTLDPSISTNDRGSQRYTAGLDYGVLSNLAVGGAWNSVVADGKRLNYFSANLRTGWRNLSLGLDATHDPLGGTIWNGEIGIPASTRFWGFNTQFQHTQYANSVLAKDDTYDIQVRSRSRIVLTGSHNSVSSRFAAIHDRLTGLTTTSYSADLSINTGVTRIGNNLNYQVYDNPSQPNQPELLTGNLYFNSKLNPLTIRGNISYQLQPESDPLRYQLNTDLNVAYDMSMSFSLEHIPASNLTSYSAGLNWQLKYLTLSPSLNYDSDGRYTGLVLATFSLAPKPDRLGLLMSGRSMANYGGVASRVFLDNDNDGTLSKDDKPLANVEVYASQVYRHEETDEHGTAYLTRLRPNKATDIQINGDSLPGISMHSAHAGNSVRPRAARWAVIDFPITATGEVDGRLYQLHGDKRIPLPGMIIELHDKNNEVIDFKISGHDGFFLFNYVPYGEYTVTLNETNQNRLTQPAAQFKLNQANPRQLGIELIVTAAKATTISPLPAAIVPAFQKSTPLPVLTDPLIESTSQAPRVTYTLQLGAFRSQATAKAAINQLRQRYSQQLQGLELQVKRTDLGAKGIFYRVHAIGELNESEAGERCRQFKQLKQSCITVTQKK